MGKKNKAKKSKATSTPTINWQARALAARGEYKPPVDALFSFGEVGFQQKWPDYSGLGFSEADVPELARLACDTRLDYADTHVAASAPIHAMRVLAQFKNSEFLPALFATFDERDDDDLFHEEMPELLATIGPSAISYVQAFFALPEAEPFHRASASNGLVAIAKKYRPVRSQIVGILMNELSHYEDNDEVWNGLLIADLIDLAAGEALPLIEKAFMADTVDDMVCGGLRDVRAEFGLVPPRRNSTPIFLGGTRPVWRKPSPDPSDKTPES